MPKNVTCDWMNLSWGMQELLGDIPSEVTAQMETVVPKVARKGAKELRSEAAKRWNGKTGKRYSEGFSSTSLKSGVVTSAEIGNRSVPGLVHLLEKGHATLTGRRTAAYPHVAPVFEKTVAPELEKEVGMAVDRALEG